VKILRVKCKERISFGILEGEKVLLAEGDPFSGFSGFGPLVSLEEVKLLPPVEPTKIIGLGLNYRDHAEEVGLKAPSEPLIFLKPSTSVIGPEEPIVIPPSSKRVDYEGELAIVISKRAKDLSLEEAHKYILGYTCFNDITARDIQLREKQWTRAKGYDTFAPLGPWIENEIDPLNLNLETLVNGERRQLSNTKNLIFNPFELVSFISHIMTLLPGDVIATGTPSGIGPLKEGDIVEVKIEGIGTLRNPVKAHPKSSNST